jgi:hypothetical protein
MEMFKGLIRVRIGKHILGIILPSLEKADRLPGQGQNLLFFGLVPLRGEHP